MCHGWLEQRRLREQEIAGRRLWEEFERTECDFDPRHELVVAPTTDADERELERAGAEEARS